MGEKKDILVVGMQTGNVYKTWVIGVVLPCGTHLPTRYSQRNAGIPS